jgi:hypothetical protein
MLLLRNAKSHAGVDVREKAERYMKSRVLALAFVAALPLVLTFGRIASAHETGKSHWDGSIYHDRSYGRHIDHEYRPDGDHIDHEYGPHGRHTDHEYTPDGRHIDHVYGRYGTHVDHEYLPDGEHIDHDYSGGRHIDRYRPPWSYDTYRQDDYDGRFYHTHRRYSDPGYRRRRYYDDDGDDYYERARYRYERSGYGYPQYDDYRDPGYGYDPYCDDSGSFDWKQDWPFLLGTMINPQIGR